MSGELPEPRGSLVGRLQNGITGIILLVILGLRKLCSRKSKCKTKLHTCCLDVDIRDETIRNSPPTSKEGEAV